MATRLGRILLSLLLLGCMAGAAFADAERGWQTLQADLNLSAEQVGKLKPILDKFRALRKGHIDNFRRQIRTVLTPEQADKMQQVCAEKPAGQRHHGMDWFAQMLSLSPQQREQINGFARENFKQMKADKEQLLAEMRSFLTPDQAQRLADMMRDHERHAHDQK